MDLFLPQLLCHLMKRTTYEYEYLVKKCSLILRGLPPGLPDCCGDRYTKPFFDRDAVVRWLSPVEAILVFPP